MYCIDCTQDAEETKRKLTSEIDDKVVLNSKVNMKEATVFVGSDDHWLYAVDANTGQVRWKYGTADETGSTCAFNHDETVVYCGTDDSSIRALNPIDGSLIWKFKTEGAVTSSIRVGKDSTLYVGCLDKNMYAINPGMITVSTLSRIKYTTCSRCDLKIEDNEKTIGVLF